MAKKKLVVWQDGAEDNLQSERYASNGGLTYSDWIAKYGNRTPRGEVQEPATSNPDLLSEDVTVWGKGAEEPTAAQKLLIEAVESLSPMQQKVWDLCMRERQLSLAKAAKTLGISKDTARTHLDRAKAAVTAYLRDHASELENDNG